MKNIKIIYVLFIIMLSPFVSQAEDIYIAQTKMGDDTGRSCANAHSITWFNTAGNWVDGLDKINAGDTVHFCGNISTTAKVQAGGTAGYPITFIFESGAKFSKAAWGTGALVSSAIHSNGNSHIIIDGGSNGIIECTDNGSPSSTTPAGSFGTQQDAEGIFLGFCDNCEVKNLTIRNLYQRIVNSNDSNKYGKAIIVTNSNNVNIHHNIIYNTYFGIHAYVSAADKETLKIYNNDVSKTSTGIVASLSGPVNYSNVHIYHNIIYDGYVWDGCWNSCTVWHHNDGIHTWGDYPSKSLGPVYIYNNEISGNFGDHTTAYIYITDYTDPAIIYNNVLYTTTASGPGNGFIALHSYRAGAVFKVFNNTIISGDNTDRVTGIYLTNTSGNAVEIKNNILMNCYMGIYDSQGKSTIAADYNNYFNVENIGRLYNNWDSTISTWRNTLGGCPGSDNECNSIITNPALNADYTPKAISLVLGAGVNMTSLGITALNSDKNGATRPATGTWSIGAYEYPSFSLTVSVSPSESGIVTSSPSGISCGSTCSVNFYSETSVTLIAAENNGYTFAGWSGACSGTGTCNITMNENKSVTATYTSSQTEASNSPTTAMAGYAGAGGGGCFIATAAYGSYLDPHVHILRDFRDHYLLTNYFGKIFVEFYYKYSPPVAKFIERNGVLKTATRWALTPLVYIIKCFMIINNSQG